MGDKQDTPARLYLKMSRPVLMGERGKKHIEIINQALNRYELPMLGYNVETVCQEEILKKDLVSLGLSARTYNAITRSGIYTIGATLDFIQSDFDYIPIRGLGIKSGEELKEVLSEYLDIYIYYLKAEAICTYNFPKAVVKKLAANGIYNKAQLQEYSFAEIAKIFCYESYSFIEALYRHIFREGIILKQGKPTYIIELNLDASLYRIFQYNIRIMKINELYQKRNQSRFKRQKSGKRRL